MDSLTATQTVQAADHDSILAQLINNEEQLIYLLSCGYPIDLLISLQ